MPRSVLLLALTAGCRLDALGIPGGGGKADGWGVDPESTLEARPSWSQRVAADGGCVQRIARAGDLDGDGRLDLAVLLPAGSCNSDEGQLQIYRGQGGGRFDPSPTSLPASYLRLEVGDFDGDGLADVLTDRWLWFGQRDDVAAIFLTTALEVASGSAFADLDGDGDVEIAAIAEDGLRVYQWRDGEAPSTLVSEVAGRLLRPIGDVNGDGATDLLVSDSAPGGPRERVFLACPSCATPIVPLAVWEKVADGVTLDAGYGLYGGSAGDVDGDGFDDLLIGIFGHMDLYRGGPNGLEPQPAWTGLGDPVSISFGFSSTPIDANGDGRDEVVVTSRGRAYLFAWQAGGLAPVWAWPNPGDPSWGTWFLYAATTVPPGEGDPPGLVLFTSSHKDGVQDLGDGLSSGAGVFFFGAGHAPAPVAGPLLPEMPSCQLSSAPLPDLVPDRSALARSLRLLERRFAADSCEVREGCVGGPGYRTLLAFTTAVANLGGGAAWVAPDDPAVYYDVCHAHKHLAGFGDYRLLDDAQGDVGLIGRKQGFAIESLGPACAGAVRGLRADAISPGWMDIYHAGIPCQWLDVTDLQPGRYTVSVAVNSPTDDGRRVIEESDYQNNRATVSVELVLRDGRLTLASP